MKKITFTLIALFTTGFLFAQTVQRSKVIVEISTGTWCQYCPGAALAADALVTAGANVAVIEYHNSDSYANAASNARNTYYSVPGYPTANFDGGNSQVGGALCPGTGVSYTTKYNNAYAVPSPLTIDISGSNSGNNYTVVLSIHKVATVSGSNLKAMLALTETDITCPAWPPNGTCLTHVNFVERLMAPDYNGTTISFASGDMQIVVLNFTKDPSWVSANCSLVAFVQDYSTKTIYNGTSIPLNALPPAVPVDFTATPTTGCAPFTTNYTDQSTGVNSWQWDFPGGTPTSSSVQNPSVSYTTTGTFDATLTAWNSTTFRGNNVVKQGIITVTAIPVAPATPAGLTQMCSNPPNQTYNVAPVAGATSYTWDLQPPTAGVITPAASSCTIDWDNAYTGTANLKVKATNSCGDSPWSPSLAITLNTQPGIPGTPTGSTLLCLNPANTDYTTSGTSPATNYIWEIIPVSAGTISGTSTTGTVDWSPTYNGTAQIHVKAVNNACEGPWSADLGVTVNTGPGVYSMTGGGATCAIGGTGVPVGLDGSQAGVNYMLYLNGTATSNIVPGTGSQITFGNQNVAGNYTSQATNTSTSCTSLMNGLVVVTVDPQVPEQPAQPTGDDTPAPGSTTSYTTSGGTYSTSYNWTVTPPSAGTFNGTGATVDITWSISYQGSAAIKVQGVNSCGGGTYSLDFPVNVTTGISEHANPKLVTIYPNPAKGMVSIIPVSRMKTDLRVLNSLGSVVIEKTGLELSHEYLLDISALAPGVYFFSLSAKESRQVQKVVVQ